ncbi:DUF4040 domain-containing protein [Nanohaloarchaea archaeon H12]|nr:DUF4040 domain-containing protein [Nanohaloarchaea archaeon H12]
MNIAKEPKLAFVAVTAPLIFLRGLAGYLSGFSSQFMFLAALIAPFLSATAIALFYPYLKDQAAYLGVISGLVSFASILSLKGSGEVFLYNWVPSLQISAGFMVDGLSVLMGLLASGVGVLVFIYSRVYMDHGEWKRKYYSVLTLFMGSMIGLVFSSNLILLFLFWELTSVCSFFLISHSQRTGSGIRASKKALLLTVGSGMILLSGLVVLGEAAGTYSLVDILSQNISDTLLEENLYLPVLVLLGVGAAGKSAQVPFHIWLPDAMEAPTPVSAFLHSATMVKAGVFLLARLRPVLSDVAAWTLILVPLGLATMCVGALLAFYADELKELLAYSTVSHLGLITASLGFPDIIGAEAASFHIFNHAVFKASLFMVAGVVLHRVGTQSIDGLSGLRNRFPVLSVAATVSAVSMAGIPLFGGFYSKELLFKASYGFASASGLFTWFVPLAAVFGSVFTFLYSFRFVSVFYGSYSGDGESPSMLSVAPPAVLASLAFFTGLLPNRIIDYLVQPALNSISTGTHGMSVHLIPGLKPAFGMSILTIASGVLLHRRRSDIENKVRYLDRRLPTATRAYDRSLDLVADLSDYLVDLVESSLARTHIIWVLSVASASTVVGALISGVLPPVEVSATLPLALVLSTSVASAYAVVKSDTYISSVLTLSILGFMVSIFYLLMDAPDLVMTQLVVESLSLVIFLLVLNHLPDYVKNIDSSRKVRDLFISGFAGLTVFVSVLYATAEETPRRLASYYIENALPGSGGTNIVNVILVDFRGLDTMGEISVIFMSGLAILMLFRMRGDDK